jgi:hypothetical protein
MLHAELVGFPSLTKKEKLTMFLPENQEEAQKLANLFIPFENGYRENRSKLKIRFKNTI